MFIELSAAEPRAKFLSDSTTMHVQVHKIPLVFPLPLAAGLATLRGNVVICVY